VLAEGWDGYIIPTLSRALVGVHQGAAVWQAGCGNSAHIQEVGMFTPEVLHNLAFLRREWEEAVGGRSLLSAQGNVGLILYDVVEALGLDTEEANLVLGHTLADEIRRLNGHSTITSATFSSSTVKVSPTQ
jgi:hypothetical protein